MHVHCMRGYMGSMISCFNRVRDIIVEDQFKHLDVEEHFYDEFPESITLDQTVAVWKHIVEYQERLKQE